MKRRYFTDAEDFQAYVFLKEPKEIFQDDFDKEVPYIIVMKYENDELIGKYNGQGVLIIEDIHQTRRLFEEGMYVKQ